MFFWERFIKSVSIPQFSDDDELTDEDVNARLKKHQEIVVEQVKKDAGLYTDEKLSYSVDPSQ